MLLGTQKINDKGHLQIGGCDVVDLAAEYGTPLYVMDEEEIIAKCRAYRSALANYYGRAHAAYASKAFCTVGMCKLMNEEGMYLDVASAGELYTAKVAEFPSEKIIFHGNNKSHFELEMAVAENVGFVVCDSFGEIEDLAEIAAKAGKVQGVMLRVNPGVDPHTHSLIRTGQEDSKFGFNIHIGLAMKAVKAVLAHDSLNLRGLHCHVGSQLFEPTPFVQAAPIMTEFINTVTAETGKVIEHLDMGGGLGVRYLEDDAPLSVGEFVKLICDGVKAGVEATGIKMPTLLLEPGRSIAGEAGTTLYTVGAVKEVPVVEEPGRKYYLSVDGGLSDNPRPSLYDAVYTAEIANKMNDAKDSVYTVSGKHCETDTLIPKTNLQKAERGDILAVLTTGAYNFAMASNYNRLPRPAVVFVSWGKSRLDVKRQTLEDLVLWDVK